MSVEGYEPIPCIQHERLEFATLKRQRLWLEYQSEEGVKREKVLPLDVATKAGAEWLTFRPEGEEGARVVRLDRILAFEDAH